MRARQQAFATEHAFEQVYREHGGTVLAYCLRRTDRQLAEDALAETFAIAWRRRGEIPQVALPWLLGVARKVLANQYRSARRRAALAQRVESARPSPWTPPETSGDGEVTSALATLKPADREVLMIAAWEELSSSDAGRVLGCSATAYRLRLLRAKRRLALELSARSAHVDRPEASPATEEARP
jgi:RNA polymerase sigma-70 factor (ECF subfamily)